MNQQIKSGEQIKSLERRVREMARIYSESPESVNKGDVMALIYDTYRCTADLLKAKMERGEPLSKDEQEIYALCQRELRSRMSQEEPVQSVFGALFSSIELIRNCIQQVKYWFDLTTETDIANRALIAAGNELLPGYAGIISDLFTTVAEFFVPVLTPTTIGLAEAQAECALRYQKKLAIDKAMASTMLTIAGYAYEGKSSSEATGFRRLAQSELPASLRILYDEQKGLLSASNGMRVWLGKKDDEIVVAYSGTDVQNMDMIYADIIQLSATSILYLKAAGLLKLLLDHFGGKKFYVTGHSLGGGLTQFSVCANMKQYADRLQGFGYNPAGLSMTSVRYLKAERLLQASEKIRIFMTCYDPVSLVGGKLGCLTTLPKTSKNGHGMADLLICMQKYLETPAPAPPSNVCITWKNHNDTDFIPYTRKLIFQDQRGTVYPVFHQQAAAGGAQTILSVNIPEPLFAQLGFQTHAADCCLGVYNKLNGTSHTVMNRMLLLTQGSPKVTDQSIGNIQSSLVYGKFGLETKQLVDILEKAYAESKMAFSDSRTTYEQALATLHNPLEYDKQAWCTAIWLQFGIDMKVIFNRWPLAEKNFDLFLNKITADRADLYISVKKKMLPTAQAARTFLTAFRALALRDIDELLTEAAKWQVITAAEKTRFLKEIDSFCSKVLRSL